MFKVYQSAAGYYIGTYCDCGPYTRESKYFRTRGRAEMVLVKWGEGHLICAR